MADEPENLTLVLLREMRAEMREGFEKAFGELGQVRDKQDRLEAEHKSFASLLGKVADAVTAIATTQEHHSELLGKLYEIQQNSGARLNAIEGRLAIIEKHTGLVRA